MLHKLFHFIIAPRHPWRRVGFSELSEMYMAGFLKTFANGMIGVFIPLYLLSNGYSLQLVFCYYALAYAFALIFDLVSAHLVARFGPKHVMRLGFFLQFITALVLSQFKALPAPLFILAFTHAAAACFYWLPYHVDFSKIKHVDHSGKEISWMHLTEKVGGIAGPFIGGILATFFGESALFYTAAVVLAAAVFVLMLSPEPVQTKQKLKFKGLLSKKDWRTHVSYSAFVAENSISILLWPAYLAAVVFTANMYLKIGMVTSISVAVATLVALPLGRLLDKNKGKSMITHGTLLNSFTHCARLFVSGVVGASAVAAVNEPGTLVYRLAYLKGFYDSADDYPGQRIAYIAKSEIIAHACCLLIWGGLALLAFWLSSFAVCAVGFLAAAGLSLMVRLQRFKALA